jgi:hypothetical protein
LEKERKAFSLTSALVSTCPVDFLSSAFGKNTWKIEIPVFQNVKKANND